ncbi:MAG: hypothetical protein PHP70_06085 [Gallionella sp.]|nr:hypothetical protein [Gallionella sp.]
MENATNEFQARLNGRFQGILQWSQLDELWTRVKIGEWYVYQLGELVPQNPLKGEALAQRIDALDALLHREHDETYCGIVYADDAEAPTLIKVYDPSHMGSSCSTVPSPPGWILSATPPQAIELHTPVPNNRRRWWQLFLK